jgi:ACS family hexuronate transporter-like MFS transporter
LPPKPDPGRWWVCALLLCATTLSYMDSTALNQMAVRLADAFRMNETMYGNLEVAFRFAFAFGTLFSGWVVDKGGVRWVYPICVAGWSAVGFLTGFADSYAMLFLCRFFLGMFEGGNWPSGIKTIRQIMPIAERSLGNSLFQSGTALGSIVTPAIVLVCIRFAGWENPDAWRLPFQVIGLVGFAWVAMWAFTVPNRRLATVEPPNPAEAGTSYWAIYRDPRFYVCLLIVMAVNTSWHTVRVWMPKYLQLKAGYTESEMSYFIMGYNTMADAGSWTVGLTTLLLIRRGLTVRTTRFLMYAGCTGLVLLSALMPVVGYGWVFVLVFMLYGFGALGLFPTYFALSQDFSAKHQGKVSGTLGFLNALYLSVVYNSQGRFLDGKLLPGLDLDRFGRYEVLFMYAGVPALISLIALLFFWRAPKSAPGGTL